VTTYRGTAHYASTGFLRALFVIGLLTLIWKFILVFVACFLLGGLIVAALHIYIKRHK